MNANIPSTSAVTARTVISPVPAPARNGVSKITEPGPKPAAQAVGTTADAPTRFDPREQARRVAAELAELAPPSASLRFRVDPDADEVVVSVVDARTGDVLRQIPSEEALAIARQLAASGSGIVSDKA